ncbi:Bax inhibitor-1/YccA family protein [Paludibacter sp.]|uniref:Bax inhibitor-1/YccA family protein n=1 Tax=Paludibacter sp. TaxID=1898105 RepID=UPI00135361E4|nr:Bax inhibitor-1/YccA family protein [Paludibacter sp.]MTK52651.1 Bax inhibitor-1/YccA family protein [Paludibacter sp.]
MENNDKYSARQIAAETQRYITKVYLWMSLALIITGGVAVWTASSPDLIALLLGNKYVFMGLLISEFLLVAFLVGWVKRMSPEVASLVFLGYSALNGFTFSVIFLTFTMSSIATTFFITAGTFAVMSIYGYFTNTDLTRWGNLLIMALFGLVIASFINLLYQSETLDWITTYAGIFIFVGLIAYDTQKIKQMNIIGNEGSDDDKREAIIGALTLYLDFINLFLKLLRLFGRRK